MWLVLWFIDTPQTLIAMVVINIYISYQKLFFKKLFSKKI